MVKHLQYHVKHNTQPLMIYTLVWSIGILYAVKKYRDTHRCIHRLHQCVSLYFYDDAVSSLTNWIAVELRLYICKMVRPILFEIQTLHEINLTNTDHGYYGPFE